jgi:hypothetical protein
MRLSDARLRQRKRRQFIQVINSLHDPTKTRPRDRSSRGDIGRLLTSKDESNNAPEQADRYANNKDGRAKGTYKSKPSKASEGWTSTITSLRDVAAVY